VFNIANVCSVLQGKVAAVADRARRPADTGASC